MPNSLPTTIPPKEDFNQQWDILKQAFKDTHISMDVVNLLVQALIQINNTGGYGSVTITVLQNFIQELKIVQTKRTATFLLRDQEPPPVPHIDNLDQLL